MRLGSQSRTAHGLPVIEAVAAGLSYGALLCWVSVCILGSFRPDGLPDPYWSGLPHARSDTTGIVAFAVVAGCGTVAEYLRLRRRQRTVPAPELLELRQGAAELLAAAASRMTALLSTGLVLYLSVNAVTHPATLAIHVTHLVSWPTEGTLRVVALLLSTGSVAASRYLAVRAASAERGPRAVSDVVNLGLREQPEVGGEP
jgi:hypothetical protein